MPPSNNVDYCGSEVEEAKARLEEASAQLKASEADCRDLKDRLSLLEKKTESSLGQERLKVRHVHVQLF